MLIYAFCDILVLLWPESRQGKRSLPLDIDNILDIGASLFCGFSGRAILYHANVPLDACMALLRVRGAFFLRGLTHPIIDNQ